MKKILIPIFLMMATLANAQWKTHAGYYQWDFTKVLNVGAVSDTAAYKPFVIGSDGELKPFSYWPAGASGGSSPWNSNANGIHYIAGKVGIGINLPTNDLHVYSTTAAGGISVDGNNNPAFSIKNAGTTKGYWAIAASDGGFLTNALANDMIFRAETSGSRILFGVGATDAELLVSSNSTKINSLNDGTGVARMVTVNNGVFGYQNIPSGGTASNLATDNLTQDAENRTYDGNGYDLTFSNVDFFNVNAKTTGYNLSNLDASGNVLSSLVGATTNTILKHSNAAQTSASTITLSSANMVLTAPAFSLNTTGSSGYVLYSKDGGGNIDGGVESSSIGTVIFRQGSSTQGLSLYDTYLSISSSNGLSNHIIDVRPDKITFDLAGSTATILAMFIKYLPVYDSEAAASSLATDRVYKTSTGELRIKL